MGRKISRIDTHIDERTRIQKTNIWERNDARREDVRVHTNSFGHAECKTEREEKKRNVLVSMEDSETQRGHGKKNTGQKEREERGPAKKKERPEGAGGYRARIRARQCV